MSPLIQTYTSYTEFTGYEDTFENRIDDGNIFYTKSATNKGVVIGASSVTNIPVVYELVVNVMVGQKTFVKTVNIVLLDDNTALHM